MQHLENTIPVALTPCQAIVVQSLRQALQAAIRADPDSFNGVLTFSQVAHSIVAHGRISRIELVHGATRFMHLPSPADVIRVYCGDLVTIAPLKVSAKASGIDAADRHALDTIIREWVPFNGITRGSMRKLAAELRQRGNRSTAELNFILFDRHSASLNDLKSSLLEVSQRIQMHASTEKKSQPAAATVRKNVHDQWRWRAESHMIW
jgi:hypothetical protein